MEETSRQPGHELVQWLESEPQPLSQALEALDRWSYIHRVASAALRGRVVDRSLPQIIADPLGYLQRSGEAVQALWDWTSRYCTEFGITLSVRPLMVEDSGAPPAA